MAWSIASMATNHSVNQVCTFLQNRNVGAEVVEKFRSEKMDAIAVQEASESELKKLGLEKTGDLLSLKAYVSSISNSSSEKEERTEKKRKLLLDLCESSGLKMNAKKKKKTMSQLGHDKTSRVVQCGWMHYQSTKRRYVPVRLARGGGNRSITFELTSQLNEILSILRETFFPDGQTTHGDLSSFVVNIGDFKGELITAVDTTLAQYVEAHKLSRVRLYILTKEEDTVVVDGDDGDHITDEQEKDEVSEDEFSKSIFSYSHLPVLQDFDLIDKLLTDKPEQPSTSTLIGSSAERQTLRQEQDKAYLESLSIDQAQTRKVNLKQARASRVPDEPAKGQPQVTVSVRHLTLGLITRAFGINLTASAVYDWVGSLTLTPEYFILSTHTAVFISPKVPIAAIDKQVLYMNEKDASPNFPEDDLNFLGYGLQLSDLDKTLETTIGSNIYPNWHESCNPPAQINLVDGDDGLAQVEVPTPSTRRDSRLSDPGYRFRQSLLSCVENDTPENVPDDSGDDISSMQEIEQQVDECMPSHSVHRSQVKKDLIRLFADPSIMEQVIHWVIIDDHGRAEKGVGSGVQRDIFSLFWQSMFASLTVGDVEKVPSIRHDHQKVEWEAIARILVYGFKHSGYVPICLSPVFLASCMHGEESTSKDDLLTSFSYYITADEREVMQKCLSGELECQDEDVLELLSSYKCFKQPTKENIKVILHELAHQEIIQKPQYIAKAWGPILDSLKKYENFSDVQSIRKLFLDKKPTAKKVLKVLRPKINNDSEKQSFEFLKKFIKSLEASSLKVFLKFITGSDVLVHNEIQVAFIDLDGVGRRPIPHTCGPLLEVPSTYQSYNELSEEFTNILREKESWTFNIV